MAAHWAVLVFAATFLNLATHEPTTNPVAALIDRLGSIDYRQRQLATNELETLGESALSALKSAAISADTERAHRAAELVRRIEQRSAAAKILAPTLVEVDYHDKPVPDAIRDFATRTGLPLVLSGNLSEVRKRNVTLKYGPAPVWNVLAELARAAKLSEWDGVTPMIGMPAPSTTTVDAQPMVIQNRGQIIVRRGLPQPVNPVIRQIVFYDAPPVQMPSNIAGAIRIRALPIGTALPNVTPDADEIIVPLIVSAESKMTWQSAPSVKLGHATDELGQQLNAAVVSRITSPNLDDEMLNNLIVDGSSRDVMATQRHQFVALRLNRPERPSRTLHEVRGTLSIPIRVRGEIVAISNPLQAAGKSFRGGYGSMTLHSIERKGDGNIACDVSIELSGDVQASPWLFNARNVAMMPGVQVQVQGGASGASAESIGLSLLDSASKKYAIGSVNSHQGSFGLDGMRMRLGMTFHPNSECGDPARLVYTASHPASVEVPFHFTDLKLP